MTSFKEITMISADRMRSVVMADFTRLSSASGPLFWTVSVASLGEEWKKERIFSAPSKHK